MKNKKNTYILLFAVLLIWGLVLYRFFSYASSEENIVENTGDITIKPVILNASDTVSLNVNYRDPFLGKMYIPEGAKKAVTIRTHKLQEQIVWPPVIYKGIVSDSKNKKKVFMLIINGQTFFMKEKDTEQDITLKKGDRYSITVKYKGDLTTIMIQE